MENYKKRILFDEFKNDEKNFINKTNVIVKNSETGEVVFRGSNKVIVSGSAFTAAKHFNINMPVRTPSYNSILGLENTASDPFADPGLRREEKVVLFAVGTDGCGPQQHEIYTVNYKKWIMPESLVPFRYPLIADDISQALKSTYFGRKTIGTRVAYYFKAFDSIPVAKQQYKDGTPIDENIYTATKGDEVETYIELTFKVTKDDCREWFINTTGINTAKINTFSLLTAWPKDYSGIKYYQDIRPLTKINISNESLIDASKGLDVIYQIFY